MSDKIKIVIAALVVAAGISAFYYLGDKPAIAQWGALLIAVAVAVVVFVQTAAGKATWEFVKASRGELRKVVWPTNKETMQVTLVVFGMVVLVAVFLWVIDWGLLKVMRALTGQGA